jgi:hypothetical protein
MLSAVTPLQGRWALSPKEVAQTPTAPATDGPTPAPAAGPSERTRRFLTELLPVIVGVGVGAVVYVAYGGAQQGGAGGTLVLTDSVIIGAVIWFVTRVVLRRIFPRPPAA